MCLQHLDLCKHLWEEERRDGRPTGQLTVWPVVRLFDQAWLDSIALPGRPLKRTILNRKIKTQNKFNVLFVPTSLCLCVWVSLCVFASACSWGSLRRGQRCWRQLTLAPTRLVCNKTSDSARWAKTAICGWKTGSSLDWILVNNTSKEEEEARNHESPPWQDQQQPDLWIFKSFQIAKSEADYEARKWSTNIMCTCLKSSNMKCQEGEGEGNSKYVQVKCFRKKQKANEADKLCCHQQVERSLRELIPQKKRNIR